MTLEQLRPLVNRALEPFVDLSEWVGLTPDAVSWIALVVAFAAGLSFGLPALDGDPTGLGDGWYLVGAVLVLLNGWLDLVDGALARRLDEASDAGDVLDHVFDRYADIALVVGLAAGVDSYALGLAAVTGVLMTSYLGTQAQAVDIDRMYAGVVGRADRLVLIGMVAGVVGVLGLDPTSIPLPVVDATVTLVDATLVLLAVVGHLTAVQRLRSALRQVR